MKRRPGFTITELLVSMALIMLIMAVMAEAFTESLKTFSAMKAIGDMDQKIRAAIVILTRDLSDDHFGQSFTQLSKIPNPLVANPPAPATPTNPAAGFFVIFQSGAPTSEGSDADGNPSVRTSNGSGLLHFTVNRAKSWNNNVNIHYGRRENYLAGSVPTNGTLAGLSRFPDTFNYYSQVGEVAYFLRPTGDTTPPTTANPSGLPRFTLFRRQAVVLTDADVTTMGAATGDTTSYCDVSWSPGPKTFNRFSDLITLANRRLLPSGSYSANAPGFSGPIPIYAEENTALTGNDILLTDVLSFDIQIMRSDSSTATPATFQPVSYFDTSVASTSWSPAAATPYNIRAIQITIRVWDIKTQSTRQITIVQDM